jgi:ectoine hydroxylase-related dioxygenase (phytanoyl-CoA dioxygenase family)
MVEGNYEKNNGYTKLAGVLALSDTNENSGGFECVCGFQNYINTWCELHPKEIKIEEDENLMKNFRKILLRKGSLLVFSRELPHNIYPNNSDNFRYAQYLRMHPLSCLELDENLIQKRKELIQKLIPKQLDVSDPISQEIFMID